MSNQINDNAVAQHNLQDREPAQVAKQEQPATAEVRAMLQNGQKDPKTIGALIQANPSARNEILALLHSTLGNRFVSQVMVFADQGQGAQGRPPGVNNDLNLGLDFADEGKPALTAKQKELSAGADFADAPKAESSQSAPKDAAQEKRDYIADSIQDIKDVNQPNVPKPAESSQTAPKAAVGHGRDAAARAGDMQEVLEFEKLPNAAQKATAPASNDAPKQEAKDNAPQVSAPEQKGEAQPAVQPQEEQKPTEVPLGPVRIKASALRVRTSCDTTRSDNILGKLHHGEVVTTIGREGDWFLIEYQGQKGYIHGDYVAALDAGAKQGKPKQQDAAEQ